MLGDGRKFSRPDSRSVDFGREAPKFQFQERNIHVKSKKILEFSGTMEKQKCLAPHACPVNSEVFFSGDPVAVLGQK